MSDRDTEIPDAACGRNQKHHSRKKRKNAQKGEEAQRVPSWSFLRLLAFLVALFSRLPGVLGVSARVDLVAAGPFGFGAGRAVSSMRVRTERSQLGQECQVGSGKFQGNEAGGESSESSRFAKKRLAASLRTRLCRVKRSQFPADGIGGGRLPDSGPI